MVTKKIFTTLIAVVLMTNFAAAQLAHTVSLEPQE